MRFILLCLALAAVPFARAQDAGTLPIADAHFHLMLFMTPADLKTRMAKHQVLWAVSAGAIGGPGYGSPSERDTAAWQALGDRFVPAVGGAEMYRAERDEGVRFYAEEPSVRRDDALNRIDTQLGARPRSLAETYPNAETSSTDPLRRRRIATDGPFFRQLAEIAVRHDVPLPMHMQWHPESVAQLERLLQAQPRLIVLLSHCGKDTEAADIRALLVRQPRVYCDLSFRGTPLATAEARQHPARLIYWGASPARPAGMKPEWRQLVEDLPDRFMVGIDDVHSWDIYDQAVTDLRAGLLAQLTPATAEKVAFRNAVALFKLPATPKP